MGKAIQPERGALKCNVIVNRINEIISESQIIEKIEHLGI